MSLVVLSPSRGRPFFSTVVVPLSLAMAGSLAVAQEQSADQAPSKPGWKLVFRDEFDGKAVDTKKWNLRDPWGRERNRELQAYVEDAFEVKDGILRIKAEKRRADYGGKQRAFTSGIMTTYQKFSQQFGRFEIRCRIPKGTGLWPAFWLLPEPLGWPPEIDVLEVLGQDTKTIYFTHHWEEPGRAHASDSKPYQSKQDLAAGFHVVAIEWTPTDIRWALDGKERFRSRKSIPQTRMYLLLNLAVGGDWPGPPNEQTVFPAYFEIDYVRVYQKE
jgi:beta-glucanase (GH16 family)